MQLEQIHMLPLDKSLLDHMPGHFGWKDANRSYQGANKALLEFIGVRDLKDITGKTDEELSPESVEDNKVFVEQDLRVLKGDKISTVHRDSKTSTIFLLEKSPIVNQENIITGLIYYCRPWHKADVFHILSQLDNKLDLGIQNYTLGYHHNKFKLTKRECECVFLLIRGKTAKEIAGLLSLSKRTVESYVENIKNKMNCQNKVEILVKAISNGYQNQIPSRLNHPAIMQSL